jgi:excisionase family DNA binding protein
MAKNHPVMTLAEAARFLRLPPKYIQKKVETGEIPGQHIGRAWRFSRAALERWRISNAQYPPVMTLAEAAKFLQLPPKYIQEKVKTGEIPGQRIGQAWRFSAAALANWLRFQNTQRTLREQIGAFKDDETFLPMVKKIYKEHRRSRKKR